MPERFRQTRPEDLPRVAELLCMAREALRALGVDQWQRRSVFAFSHKTS